MNGDEIVGKARDWRGAPVVLLGRTWGGKVLVDHPEMAWYLSAVWATVSRPGHVEADPVRRHRVRFYSCGVGLSKWLQVVVSYEQEPARIITAFAKRKDPPTWRK